MSKPREERKYPDIPRALRMARAKTSLRQEGFGRLIGLKRSSICRYENGSRDAPCGVMIRWAKAAQLSLEGLIALGYDDPKAS